MAKAVNNQSGETIALREDHSAGMQIRKGAAVFNCLVNPAAYKSVIDRFVFEAHDPKCNLRCRVIESLCKKTSA